ncbi:MAG: glycosyltransferase family 9 protein [Nitrospirae bacterium]|nr:glycosyltransferase family 9 protein [Nitrospirota bacterium]
MKNVLIINLTRMGDLVQTTPVMAGLKDAYTDVRITLLINSAFAEICNYIPFVDRLISFNMDGFIAGGRGEFPGLVSKYRYMEEMLEDINRVGYDCVINFTHTTVSAAIMSLVSSKEFRGYIADNKGHSLIKHPWLRYFFNIVPGRIYNPFHLCDIYIKAGGAMPKEKGLFLEVPEEVFDTAKSQLRKSGVSGGDFVIGFQPGASDRHKMWATGRYVELAKKLTSRLGAKVIVFGSGGERALGEEIKMGVGSDVIDMVGKTSLKELAAYLKCCNLLVSNDSGTMHIATAVGTRVIGISLGAAYFRETGPYGKGHIVIESNLPCHPCSFHVKCQDMICNDTVSVDGVYRVIEMLYNDGRLKEVDDSPLWDGMQVNEAVFSDDGLLEYIPRIKRPITREDFFRHLYRLVWLQTLDHNAASIVPENSPLRHHPDKSLFSKVVTEGINGWEISNEIDALRSLKELAGRALEKVSLIAEEAKRENPDIAKIKDIWADVPLIDQDIDIIGFTNIALRPIVIYFKFGRESLEGEDVAVLASAACTLYKNLIIQTSAMIQLIEPFNNNSTLTLEGRGVWQT